MATKLSKREIEKIEKEAREELSGAIFGFVMASVIIGLFGFLLGTIYWFFLLEFYLNTTALFLWAWFLGCVTFVIPPALVVGIYGKIVANKVEQKVKEIVGDDAASKGDITLL